MLRARRALLAIGFAAALLAGASGPRSPAGYYASPTGMRRGAGSRGQPWDLGTALAGGNGKVQPGDTIWLRGGTYAGSFDATLTGTPSAPIVVRQYPAERATIDGNLRVRGAYATYWGFEIMQSNPVANGNNALETYGPNCRFVNLIVHDAGAEGVSFWESAGTAELYGSIVYNNGTHDGLDHGIYADNDAGEKWIVDNVVFANLAYGIHVYAGSRHPQLTDVHVRGNVAFSTGTISPRGWLANLLVGGDGRTQRMTVDSNLLYFPDSSGLNLRLGLPRGDNRDVVVRGNVVVGGHAALFMQAWARADVVDNQLAGAADIVDLRSEGPGALGAWHWSGNTFYRDAAAKAWRYQRVHHDLTTWQAMTGLGNTGVATGTPPTTPQVFVRPNKYEAGRATIVIYNWGRQAAVNVDVSTVVSVGAPYEVRAVENLFGAPVASGRYDGGAISIPMSGVRPPPPLAGRGPGPPPTGPDFGVFIVTSPRP